MAATTACAGGKGTGGGGAPGGDGGAGGAGGAPAAFEPISPASAASKVKNLLTGLPLSNDELAAVVADPRALPGLVDRWIALPEWRTKMFDFFQKSFQQTQTFALDYDDQIGDSTQQWNPLEQVRFVKSAEASFALTALQFIADGRPFTEVASTERFMLNPPLMAILAFIDALPRNDAGRVIASESWILARHPTFKFTRVLAPAIPVAESVDPASPNFMIWTDTRTAANPANPACTEPQSAAGVQGLIFALNFLYGGRPGCAPTGSQFTEADWNAWRMVTVRAPRPGEARTAFYDVLKLRDPRTTELVLATPRVGFFSTLAFLANWPTNDSNQYRVTTNQALIVGLGRSFDDRGTTVQLAETSVDALHVQPGTGCYGCHQVLDPMRDFFKANFSIPYAGQTQAQSAAAVGTFTVDGSAPVSGQGIRVFGQAMAAHPLFAPAWAQKLCQFANSASCAPDDPEFQRVAAAFQASGFDFKTLTRELFSSPLVTFLARTATGDQEGQTMSIARREAFCAALEHRLELADPCQLRNEQVITRGRSVPARNLSLSIPGAGYARGDDKPLLPRDPSLFFHSATENLCALVASQVVDAGNPPRYRAALAGAAIDDFTANLMGLTAGDPRAAAMKQILADHHAEALAAGASPTDALRSTFTLACASPLGISSGL